MAARTVLELAPSPLQFARVLTAPFSAPHPGSASL
jgi:hypothetical protein